MCSQLVQSMLELWKTECKFTIHLAFISISLLMKYMCILLLRFHGYGTLHFTNGGKFEAEWERGKAVGPGAGGQYTFKDGLQYQEDEWKYCDGVDRRFWTEVCKEIKPAGIFQHHITVPNVHHHMWCPFHKILKTINCIDFYMSNYCRKSSVWSLFLHIILFMTKFPLH